MARVKKAKSDELNFEEAIIQLEAVIDKMENGELSLADSLTEFERGIFLSKTCMQLLEQAEEKVRVVCQEQDNFLIKDFEN